MRDLSSAGIDVSRETLQKLEKFSDLVERWTPRINLIAPSTIAEIWDRHIVDSAQLVGMVEEPDKWIDIGSGGGFPGIVVAILLAEMRPNAQVTLVESDRRKCVFLKSAIRELGLSTDVLNQRTENVTNFDASAISARALARLKELLPFVEQNLSASGCCLFPKGEKWSEEVDDAQEEWSFELEVIQSITNPNSAVLKIQNPKRRSKNGR